MIHQGPSDQAKMPYPSYFPSKNSGTRVPWRQEKSVRSMYQGSCGKRALCPDTTQSLRAPGLRKKPEICALDGLMHLTPISIEHRRNNMHSGSCPVPEMDLKSGGKKEQQAALTGHQTCQHHTPMEEGEGSWGRVCCHPDYLCIKLCPSCRTAEVSVTRGALQVPLPDEKGSGRRILLERQEAAACPYNTVKHETDGTRLPSVQWAQEIRINCPKWANGRVVWRKREVTTHSSFSR